MWMSVSSRGCAAVDDAATLRARTTASVIRATSWSEEDTAKISTNAVTLVPALMGDASTPLAPTLVWPVRRAT